MLQLIVSHVIKDIFWTLLLIFVKTNAKITNFKIQIYNANYVAPIVEVVH